MPTVARAAPAASSPKFHERKPVRGSLVWWLRFLGAAAFLILLVRLPRSEQVHLERLDLRWLGLGMLLTVAILLLEALVWQWLLGVQRIRHPYPKTLMAYLASQYLGLVTPGHVGEFLAAGYVSMHTGLTFGYALSSVVMRKVLAWITLIGFGVWGLPLLGEVSFLKGVGTLAALSVVAVVALALGIGLWVVSLRRLTRRWEHLSPWQVDMTEFRAGMRHLRVWRLLIPLGLSIVAFSLLFVQLDAVLRALGIALPFGLVARILAVSRIAARLIPISAFGLGSKDAAVVLLLAQHQVDIVAGLAVTLLFLVCSHVVTLLLAGVCWWINPLVIRRAAPAAA
jgi:hypothetical protein